MEGKTSMLALVLGLLAVMVPATLQFHVNYPLYADVQRVNDKAPLAGGSSLGIILTSTGDEKQLLASGYFVVDESNPYKTIAGRKFNIGTFNGVSAVYVLAGEPLAAVSVTVQIMCDAFAIGVVISTGGGRSIDNELTVGDVAVLYSSAYTGVWYWQEWESSSVSKSKTPNATLTIGEYNYPEAGDNKLASIKFQSVTRYTPTSSKKNTFWFTVSTQIQKLAPKLKGVKLDKCEGDICKIDPKVVIGLKAASSDIYLVNEAYGNFLAKNLGVSVVDKQSAAVSATAYANGVPYALFRAATNKPGVTSNTNLIALATRNSIKVAAAFAELISKSVPTINYYEA